ncbi:MAG: thioesterase domain-containing protein, partial [Pseudomonadota bacterium]
GYLNRPELTAEKFIEIELFGRTERVYKTGDLARWLPDGNLEYLGRLDQQVKLRGFRIELGEIEAVLAGHDAVREAVVVLYRGDDNPRLAAYVTLAEGADAAVPEALKTHLKARLPDYMIPAQLQILEQLPLTPNGKLDRKALPAPGPSFGQDHPGLPRDAVELRLLHLWQSVLQVSALGIHESFFDLGGHSLLAVKLMSHIQQEFGCRLPVSGLFAHPSVAQLAELLRSGATALAAPPVVALQPPGGGLPIHCLPGAIGSVLYLYPLACRLGTDQPVYALPTPGLDGTPAPASVPALAARHLEALRRRQPRGPYRLAGHSSGGRAAFELAWQLEQQGETVALLAILDTSAPDPEPVGERSDDTAPGWLRDLV